MLSPYRNSSQKKPLTANTHFRDDAPFNRMKSTNSISVGIFAIPNCATGAQIPQSRERCTRTDPGAE